jgi:hypothetical protein
MRVWPTPRSEVKLLGALIAAAAIATIASLFVALWQFIDSRHVKERERDRIVEQRERLRTAIAVATKGAESADLIVQRTKDPDVSMAELRNIARLIRLDMRLLEEQLEGQRSLLADWQVGNLVMSRGAGTAVTTENSPQRQPDLPVQNKD